MTTIYVGVGPTSRIVHFRYQSAFHHRQAELNVKKANRIALHEKSCREKWFRSAQRHLSLATACDYASFHPWLSLGDAQAITSPSAFFLAQCSE